MGKNPVGLFWIVRNTFISIALLFFTQKGPVGKMLIRNVRYYLASREIARIARSLNFIISPGLILAQQALSKEFPEKLNPQGLFCYYKIMFLPRTLNLFAFPMPWLGDYPTKPLGGCDN
jgi:hypothetical protein